MNYLIARHMLICPKKKWVTYPSQLPVSHEGLVSYNSILLKFKTHEEEKIYYWGYWYCSGWWDQDPWPDNQIRLKVDIQYRTPGWWGQEETLDFEETQEFGSQSGWLSGYLLETDKICLGACSMERKHHPGWTLYWVAVTCHRKMHSKVSNKNPYRLEDLNSAWNLLWK